MVRILVVCLAEELERNIRDVKMGDISAKIVGLQVDLGLDIKYFYGERSPFLRCYEKGAAHRGRWTSFDYIYDPCHNLDLSRPTDRLSLRFKLPV
jgi:hypothetical protein